VQSETDWYLAGLLQNRKVSKKEIHKKTREEMSKEQSYRLWKQSDEY